jgi:ATP-dependent RNA helicase SUPV3L1/SUV3
VAADTAEETETFYTFTWGRNPRGNNRVQRQGSRDGGRQNAQGGNRREGSNREGGNREGGRGRGKPGGKPNGKPGGKAKSARKDQGAKTYSARPPKKEKAIDPDNPFAAALMGLKQGD